MPELPSGTVTFLFTDIEGSTRLLKHLRERYGEVLAEQQRLLREAVADAGGREIDTQGDAFFFAFPTAKEAVTAALVGPRTLAGHEWTEGNEVVKTIDVGNTPRGVAVGGGFVWVAVS